MPVQAFVTAASSDKNVQQITITDSFGIIRGSSNPKLVGQPYRVHSEERLLRSNAAQAITSTGSSSRDGYRIVHTIRYAGRPFGTVDLVVGKAELRAAMLASRNLLLALGAFMFLVVLCVSFLLAQLLQRPLHRLQKALGEAAKGKLDFRISHRRTDEFGQLFDAFNTLAASLESREWGGDTIATGSSLDATRIDARPAIPFEARRSAAERRSA